MEAHGYNANMVEDGLPRAQMALQILRVPVDDDTLGVLLDLCKASYFTGFRDGAQEVLDRFAKRGLIKLEDRSGVGLGVDTILCQAQDPAYAGATKSVGVPAPIVGAANLGDHRPADHLRRGRR
jgi:hypothetical protein